MIKITWFNGEVPNSLETHQVYGLVFTTDGRMLLKVEEEHGKKFFAPAGGTPENFDTDRIATLRREMIEEVNTTLKDKIVMVGYQKIEGDNGKPPYAQVRMTAIIDKIGPVQPDPDNGKTYERLLTSPERAIQLMNWGEVGKAQIEEAVRLARQELGLTTFSDVEEYV